MIAGAYWHGLIVTNTDGVVGPVLFKFHMGTEPGPDGLALAQAFGQPIGTAFGNSAEIWLCGPTLCLRWYPLYSADLPELERMLRKHFRGAPV